MHNVFDNIYTPASKPCFCMSRSCASHVIVISWSGCIQCPVMSRSCCGHVAVMSRPCCIVMSQHYLGHVPVMFRSCAGRVS